MMQERSGDERSLGDLFGELARELTALIRQEAALAKTEMGAKAAQIGKDVGFIAAGGAVAYAGLLGILAAVIAPTIIRRVLRLPADGACTCVEPSDEAPRRSHPGNGLSH